MRLVQLLLPVKSGVEPSGEAFDHVLEELTDRFGGATASIQSPAEGLWRDIDETERDRIVFVEVMVEEFDSAWWIDYRRSLEERFDEKEIVVRALPMQKV